MIQDALRRLPRTLARLVARPGSMARAWSLGQRSDVVSPVSLYAILALVFFLVWPHWGGSHQSVVELFQRALTGVGEERRLRGISLEPPVANFIIAHFESVFSLVLLPWMAAAVRLTHSGPRGFAGAMVFTLDFHSFVLLCALVTAPLLALHLTAGVALVALGCVVFLVASLRGAHDASWPMSTLRGVLVGGWCLLGIFLLGRLMVTLRVPF